MRYALILFGAIMLGFGIQHYILTPVTISVRRSIELQKQVDSLTMEIHMRDIMIGACKDTVYGEEVAR